MRFFLLLACCAISLNTSAQFWKKKVRYAALEPAKATPAPQFSTPSPQIKTNITYINYAIKSVFDFDQMRFDSVWMGGMVFAAKSSVYI